MTRMNGGQGSAAAEAANPHWPDWQAKVGPAGKRIRIGDRTSRRRRRRSSVRGVALWNQPRCEGGPAEARNVPVVATGDSVAIEGHRRAPRRPSGTPSGRLRRCNGAASWEVVIGTTAPRPVMHKHASNWHSSKWDEPHDSTQHLTSESLRGNTPAPAGVLVAAYLTAPRRPGPLTVRAGRAAPSGRHPGARGRRPNVRALSEARPPRRVEVVIREVVPRRGAGGCFYCGEERRHFAAERCKDLCHSVSPLSDWRLVGPARPQLGPRFASTVRPR